MRLSYAPPQGSDALRKQVAALHDVDPDWVVITTGASEALSALYCLASEPGASITLPSPAFPAMPVMARAWGLNVSAYTLDRASGFKQSAERVLAAVGESTRLVLINTPHNPTGSVMPQTEIARLATNLEHRLIPLVVDEVYHPLYHGAPVSRFGGEAAEHDRRRRSVESALAAGPAHRLGDRSRCATARTADRPAQLLHHFRLAVDRGDCRARAREPRGDSRATACRRRCQSRRADRFHERSRGHVGWVAPAGGTTVFPWLRDGSDARELCVALASAGVLFAPGYCFDAPEHFRLGFGAQSEGFAQALNIVSDVLRAPRRLSAAAGALR